MAEVGLLMNLATSRIDIERSQLGHAITIDLIYVG